MKIVILEPLGVKEEKINELAKPLRAKGHELVYYTTRTEDRAEIMKRSKDAEALVVANLPLDYNLLSSLDNLKMISVAFTGVDHISDEVCRQNNIVVCNAAGYSTQSVAELTFGLIFSVYRKIIEGDKAVRSQLTRNGLTGNQLYGKTIGIVGTGEIGMRVAKLAKAFGCKILAFSRSMKDEILDLYVKYTTLEHLMKNSDIITLHVPLNDKTKNMINASLINTMKPNAVLINTARGGVIDSKALAEALNSGKIAGAGIDVFEMEPPIPADHPLLNAKNTVLLPHVAFATKEALEIRAKIAIDNIISWLEGNEINRVI